MPDLGRAYPALATLCTWRTPTCAILHVVRDDVEWRPPGVLYGFIVEIGLGLTLPKVQCFPSVTRDWIQGNPTSDSFGRTMVRWKDLGGERADARLSALVPSLAAEASPRLLLRRTHSRSHSWACATAMGLEHCYDARILPLWLAATERTCEECGQHAILARIYWFHRRTASQLYLVCIPECAIWVPISPQRLVIVCTLPMFLSSHRPLTSTPIIRCNDHQRWLQTRFSRASVEC